MAKKKQTPKTVKELRIGVVDTMFARFDMGASARAELESCSGFGESFTVISRTTSRPNPVSPPWCATPASSRSPELSAHSFVFAHVSVMYRTPSR